MNVLCEIPNTEIKITTMKHFITKIKEYRKDIFTEMKKSKYFKTFLNQNQINEKTYELLEEEILIDFLIKNKLDIIVKNNEAFIKENYNLNQMVITLEEERKRQDTEMCMLKEKNLVLISEIENLKKSTSWRITKPIRMLKNLINRIRRRK